MFAKMAKKRGDEVTDPGRLRIRQRMSSQYASLEPGDFDLPSLGAVAASTGALMVFFLEESAVTGRRSVTAGAVQNRAGGLLSRRRLYLGRRLPVVQWAHSVRRSYVTAVGPPSFNILDVDSRRRSERHREMIAGRLAFARSAEYAQRH